MKKYLYLIPIIGLLFEESCDDYINPYLTIDYLLYQGASILLLILFIMSII